MNSHDILPTSVRSNDEQADRDLAFVDRLAPRLSATEMKSLEEPITPGGNKKHANKLESAAISLFDDHGPKSQATVLTEIGQRHHLFHDQHDEAFARVAVGNHSEVVRIGSGDYKDLLARTYFQLARKGASGKTVADAIATLTAIARYEGPCEPVHLRVGATAEGVAIDLGTREWSTIDVTVDGWRITCGFVANFRRSTKAAALPMPTLVGADFSALWKYINVEPAQRVLVAGWLLSTLRPRGPFPIMLLVGEQGTGKSQTSRILKALSDPSTVPLRAPPRDDKDLLVSALNSRVLVLDNLSGVKPELSDALCRLSTGGALAGRKLYTNGEEAAYDVQCPVILNGIDDIASRPDLAERCIHLTLPMLTTRAPESDLVLGFDKDAPKIMAALLNGVALALRDIHMPYMGRLPRMADFAKWAAAGVPALGFTREEFINAYGQNQTEAIVMGLETSDIACAVRRFIEREENWKGTAQELLSRLNQDAGHARLGMSWPHSPKGLQTALRRLAPSLRSVGIEVGSAPRTASSRNLTLKYCRGSVTTVTDGVESKFL